MDYPIYKLLISEDVESEAEVSAIALVDFPAIERDFMVFNEQRLTFAVNNEQRIVSGALMIPDKPIYRENSTMGKHYIVFDRDTIKQVAIKYAKRKNSDKVNMMHSVFVDGVTLFESFQSDASRGIQPMKGYEDLPDGTWFGSMFIENDEVWQQVQQGNFKGFSVEGNFLYNTERTDEQLLEQLKDLFQSF